MITKDRLIEIINIVLNERKIDFMPNSKSVKVKKECMVGGLPNGRSKDCNQGDMKNLELSKISEEAITRKVYNPGQIEYMKNSFDRLSERLRNNDFVKSLKDNALKNGSLTMKQHEELFYILANGKTKYNAGILNTKN